MDWLLALKIRARRMNCCDGSSNGDALRNFRTSAYLE